MNMATKNIKYDNQNSTIMMMMIRNMTVENRGKEKIRKNTLKKKTKSVEFSIQDRAVCFRKTKGSGKQTSYL
jgi:hypothetical protein